VFNQIKLYLGLGIVAAFAALYWMYYSTKNELLLLKKDYSSVVERTERDSKEIKELENLNNENLKTYKTLKYRLQNKLEEVRKLELEILNHKEQNNELVKLFSDHNFTKLIQAKPGLIQRRMRSGTERLFRELEDSTTGAGGSLPRQTDKGGLPKSSNSVSSVDEGG